MSDVLFRIVIEDAGVNAALKANREEVKKLNDALKGITAGTAEYRQLGEQLLKTKVETAQLRDRQRELNKEFQATRVPTDSLAGLRLEYGKLTAQITNLSRAERESNFGKNLIKNAASVKKEIDGIEQSVGRFTGNVGNYSSALNSFVGFVKSSLGPLAALAAAQKIISNNSAVSDRVADVAKAADISIESVNRLADVLEKRLTRTSLLDQLGIAEIGGKLGVAEKDLFSFVEAVDVVNVALGDQFGGSVEQTTDVIGKLRNVLTDIRTDNIGKDIQNIGNSLNFLEAQGAASAGTIADFAGRIAGAGRNLGVTSGQIIGVSATLDELGVNAERGASSYVRILQRVAASPAAFAKAAGVSAKEFTTLVNEDIAGALNLFLSKINDQKLSNTELQQVLKSLKLEGVGTAETVGKLGQNMELLNRRTEEAGRSLKSTDSIQQEFEKKNQTLGAAVQNLTNAFFNLTTSSSIGGFLSGVINSISSLISEIALASDSLFDFSGSTEGAAIAQDILSEATDAAAAAIGKETVATEKNFNLLRGNLATQQQRQKAIDELIKVYPTLLTQQQLESANIEQLNGLQILATNVLRDQVTERLKIRAKEQIESEIVQKQLRRAELDATPDRALLGTLTAGETVRNFGTLNPQKLRADLFAQYSIDIAQLEEQSRKVDENFNRIKIRAEDNLTAAEQDRLDLFRQFNDRGVSAGTDLKTAGSASDSGSNLLNKPPKKTKEDNELVAGSIAFLRDQVEKLKKAIDQTPGDSKLLGSFIADLSIAEFKLSNLEDKINAIKNPSNVSEDQNILNELAGGAAPGRGFDLLQSQRESAVGFNGDQLAQEEELQRRIDELDSDFDKRKRERAAKAVEEEEKKRKEMYERVRDAAFDVFGAVFAIANNRIEAEKEKQIEAIDQEYQTRIEAAQGNAVLIDQLEKEQAQKREEVEKEANEKKKKNAKTEAIIAGAVAFVEALPNIFLAALVAIQTAAQVAVIDSQQFAEGGFTGPGGQRDSTGQRVAGSYMKRGTRIIYHENEYIAPTHQLQRYPELFSFLERDRTKRYADGGYTDFVPQVFGQYAPVQSSVSASASFSREQSEMIGKIIADEVSRRVEAAVERGSALGVNKGTRDLERQNIAEQNRQI
jgi:TP901 family phage tail tape measure protein